MGPYARNDDLILFLLLTHEVSSPPIFIGEVKPMGDSEKKWKYRAAFFSISVASQCFFFIFISDGLPFLAFILSIFHRSSYDPKPCVTLSLLSLPEWITIFSLENLDGDLSSICLFCLSEAKTHGHNVRASFELGL